MFRAAIVTALFVCSLCPLVQAAAPKPDFVHLPAYLQALQQSKDPQAAAICRQINNGPHDLAGQRAAAEPERIPLTIRELQRFIPPPRQNAVSLYMRLGKLLKAKPLNLPPDAQPLDAGTLYTPQQLTAALHALAQRQDVMRLVHQAARFRSCSALSAWTDAYTPYDHLVAMQQAAMLIRTESFLLAAQGHYSQAVANQALGFRIAAQAASDPTEINYLAAETINATTLKGLYSILMLAGPNAQAADLASRAIRQSRSRLSIRHALTGETVVTILQVEGLRHGRTRDWIALTDPAVLREKSIPDQPLNAADQATVNRLLDAVEAYDIRAIRHVIAVAAVKNQYTRSAYPPISEETINPVETLAVYTLSIPLYQTTARNDALLEVALAAASALAARARSGRWPDRLPGSYPDPFSNGKLQYRREGASGFVVYSVGRDRNFTGGRPGDLNPSGQVYFRYTGVIQPPPQ